MNDRRNLLKLATLAAAGVPLFASEPAIADGVIDIPQAKLTRQPFGEERIFFTGSTGQLSSVTTGSLLLYAGQQPHPPHQHPEEEFMIVTEGQGEILVANVKHKVRSGSIMYCEGNRLHGVKNNSTAPLLFYFFKWKA